MAWADLLTHTAQIRVAHSGGSKDGAPAGQQAWALLSFFLVVAAYENANPNAAEEQYQVRWRSWHGLHATPGSALH